MKRSQPDQFALPEPGDDMYVPPAHEFPGKDVNEREQNRRLAYLCWTSWEDYATWE